MEAGTLEELLRSLPGVLDCSVTDAGVVVVVHPEVDPRPVELQATAVLADAGAARPLLVVGGMAPDPRAVPTPVVRSARRGPSPLMLAGFALLVLALLTVLPLRGQEGGDRRAALPAPPTGPARGGEGRVPVTDEEPAGTVSLAAAPLPVVATGPAAPLAASAVADAVVTAAQAPPPPRSVLETGTDGSSPTPLPPMTVEEVGNTHEKATPGKPGRRKATGLQGITPKAAELPNGAHCRLRGTDNEGCNADEEAAGNDRNRDRRRDVGGGSRGGGHGGR